MYKVFFKDRAVYFREDLSGDFDQYKGLFYRYGDLSELMELLEAYDGMEKIANLTLIHRDLAYLKEMFRSCFRFVEAAGGLVFNGKHEYLVIKRNGVWDLPKGKLERGEEFGSAALREVREETGLEGLIISRPLLSTFHTYRLADDWILKETKWFEMNYRGDDDPVVQRSEGITGFGWIKPGKPGKIIRNTYLSIKDVLAFRELL
jgi:8-oxo-dGTP pyrophosphatase MutT (NUDIX family)